MTAYAINNAALPTPEIGAHNKTMVASTVDTYTFARRIASGKLVILSGAAAIFYTTDGSTPTVGGVATRVAPAVVGSVALNFPRGATSVLKVITAGTPVVSVQSN